MSKKVLLLVLSALFCACLLADSWNILVYMAADNNLAQNAVQDFNSMESVDLPPGVRVYLQTDLPAEHSLSGGRRWRLGQDQTEQIVSTQLANLGTINSGDYNTLRSFIAWGKNQYPAERQMLVIWSHGDSWYKDLKTKYICTDDSAQEVMSVSSGHLKAALAGHTGFDILLMDACSMQTIEVLTETLGFADYVIGSQDLVPVKGFPYEDILPLFDQPLYQILDQIPELYTNSYLAGGSQNPSSQGFPTTCSVIQTTHLWEFNLFWGSFCGNWRGMAEELMQIRQYCYSMNTGLAEIDIGEFIQKVRAEYPNLHYLQLDILSSLWDTAVIAKSAPLYPGDLGSATIWFPDIRYNFDAAWRIYRKLDFASTSWLTLLNLSFGEDTDPPAAPANLQIEPLPGQLRISFSPVADPDPITYQIRLFQSNAITFHYIYPSDPFEQLQTIIPCKGSGTVRVFSLDQSGNLSEASDLSYTYEPTRASILAYPVPAKADTGIKLIWDWDSDSTQIQELKLYNLRGQVVLSRSFPASRTGAFLLEPDLLSAWASGHYFVKLSRGSQQISTRLVLQ
ncbi:MAG: hypothetical protein CVU49_06195 [Candidatus Cloacimonetes bacterium HGW-Cloacimonetes-2]|jgi:hypothetical protein|nr:MAG: hypothetical protein CVU49_06195 [Candidatus Cloacimonetes bacterium HGW-Cloacimonetes-2]